MTSAIASANCRTASRQRAFLEHLEHGRGNSARTRNIRLAAVHSFFHYCALRHPEHAALIQRVLAIPPKRARAAHRHVPHPGGGRRAARRPRPRDVGRTLRSRAAAHRRADRSARLRGAGAHARRCPPRHLPARACDRQGTKGSRRATDPPDRRGAPGLDVRVQGPERRVPAVPLMPRRVTHARRHRTSSRQARRDRAARLPNAALKACLHARAAPHRRDGAAERRIDTSTIALWLGHEQERTTHVYLHADLALKQRTLDRITPPNGRPGRYRAPDTLLAFLEAL
jgi:integrase/recombinase XerD